MDPRLAHFLEARRSLQKRWRRQRHNRKLRKKIPELGREIERHSRQLCSQRWFALCSQADGQLHRGGTWKLLGQLMNETKSCEYQRTRMAQILHTTARQLGEEEMFKRLNERYLPDHQSRRPPRLRQPAEPPPRPRSRGMGTAGRGLLDRVGLLPPGERPGAGPYGEIEEQVPLSDEAARKIIIYPLPKNMEPRKGCGQASGESSGAGPSTSERRGRSLRGRRKISGKTQRLCSSGGQRYYR
ncbi:hypothetical protein MRX96_031870 [Rhipicephalus microplus]